jgi:capsular polysaccharide biosynthesis protein
VVTLVEKPVPPLERSAPLRTLIVLLSLILGGIVAVGVAFTKAYFEEQRDEETQRKLSEIRESIVPGEPFSRVGGYFRKEAEQD